MTASKKSRPEKKIVPKPQNAGVYIDPRTDFGFKRLFGEKDLMIDFLNSVLDIKDGIVDLEYRNTVRTGISKDERATIFDLYCSTGTGEQIIVEMQNIPHEYFIDRVVYYASRLIQQQGKKGKDWDYQLPPIYSVNIVDFKLDKESKTNKYLSYIQLLDRETKKLFYDKLTLVFLELPRFKKPADKLKTNVDNWMYAIKNLPKLNETPEKLGAEVFKKLFALAKIARMTAEQQNDYYKSLHDMSLIKIQFGKMETTITEQGNTITVQAAKIAERDAKIAERDAKIAEYERRYGILSGSTVTKPTRVPKIRARNSAKLRNNTN